MSVNVSYHGKPNYGQQCNAGLVFKERPIFDEMVMHWDKTYVKERCIDKSMSDKVIARLCTVRLLPY